MAEIHEVHVSFRLSSDSLDPNVVTGQLGLTPTNAFAKGEMSPPGRVTGRSFIHRTGGWRLESPLPRSAELDDHLRALLDLLSAKAPIIRGYKDQAFTVDFFCGLFLNSFNERLELPPETLARVAALGATLSLDIYSAPGDEERAPPGG